MPRTGSLLIIVITKFRSRVEDESTIENPQSPTDNRSTKLGGRRLYQRLRIGECQTKCIMSWLMTMSASLRSPNHFPPSLSESSRSLLSDRLRHFIELRSGGMAAGWFRCTMRNSSRDGYLLLHSGKHHPWWTQRSASHCIPLRPVYHLPPFNLPTNPRVPDSPHTHHTHQTPDCPMIGRNPQQLCITHSDVMSRPQ